MIIMMMNSIINTIDGIVLRLTNSNTVLNDLKQLAYIFFIITYKAAPSSYVLYQINHRYEIVKVYIFFSCSYDYKYEKDKNIRMLPSNDP